MNDSLITSVAKQGVVGVSAVIISAITSYQEHMEWAFRCMSLFLGCCVALTTLITIVRKARRDQHEIELLALEKRELQEKYEK